MKNKKAINKPRLLLLIFIFATVAVGALFYLNIGGVRVRLTADSEAEIPIQTTDSNILIVYFTAAENSDVDAISSASVTVVDGVAKGNVRVVADMIHEYTGGDLYSIQTSVRYPGNGNKLIDYASEEQNNDARPELTSHIESFEQYDVVFIGYPTWWYDLPQVMYSFFDEYDFSGKTIIPFNSANGSQFSGTIGTIQQLEPEAKVITDGLSVHQNRVSGAQSEVEDWIKRLGF